MRDRVLFVRVGYMRYYNGHQIGDERPIGGGSHNEKGIGGELRNFKALNGVIYGYAQPYVKRNIPADEAKFNLARIDPNVAAVEFLEDVLVIFVATKPNDGQVIIGWYQRAKVFRDAQPADSRMSRDGDSYNMQTGRNDAVLLPENKRTFRIPRGPDCMGIANVFYRYDQRGIIRNIEWVKNALEFVDNYAGSNLFQDLHDDLPKRVAAGEESRQVTKPGTGPAVRQSVDKMPPADETVPDAALFEIRAALADIKVEISRMKASNAVQAVIFSEMSHIELEVESPTPRRSMLKVFLESLRDNIAKAAGAGVTTALTILGRILAKHFGLL